MENRKISVGQGLVKKLIRENTMLKPLMRQRGMSVLGMMVTIFIIIFAVLLVIKALPPYMQAYAVREALNDIAKEPNAAQMGKGKIKDKLERRLQVDGINAAITDNLVIDKQDGKVLIVLKYEKRVAVIGNIDFVFKFDEQVKVE